LPKTVKPWLTLSKCQVSPRYSLLSKTTLQNISGFLINKSGFKLYQYSKAVTPKTNGMVERVNGTIKNATVKAIMYQNIDEMKQDLNKFLIFYNFNRGRFYV
jgi:hypothetical protein